MQINLNDPEDFTIGNVGKLIASGDDNADTQLRVSKDGIAFLEQISGAEQKDGLLFRIETWDAGMALVGPKASTNARWVRDVFYFLKKNWPKAENFSMEVEEYPDHDTHPMES